MGLLNPRNLTIGARFVAALPGYLRHPIDPGEVRTIIRDRLQARGEALLALVRAALAGPGNPIGVLLRNAGCGVHDVARLVGEEGVEKALHRLLHAGVYLTVDEFKGRRSAVRGSTVVEVNPERLHNPRSADHVPASSSGSRSAGTPVLLDLAFIRGCAVDACAGLDARGGLAWRKATWEVPGAGARFRLIKYAAFGDPPERWFSQLDPRLSGQHPVIRLSMRATRLGSVLAGVPLPRPIHAPLTDPLPVARWQAETLRSGSIPHVFTFPSSAVAVCEAATRAGIELGGARFTIGGEPITAARVASVRRVGADAMPRYGTIECGPIGYGCLSGEHPDELHVLADLNAVIQAEEDGPVCGLPPDALLVTSLHPNAPFTLLNVSMGDCGALTSRQCGCPLESLGWRDHIHDVRSFEKMTGTGMTFMRADIVRIIEEVLPAHCGGGPTDFQLVEDEDETGRAVLRLLVDPEIGPIDEQAAVRVLLEALGAGSPADRVMAAMLAEAGVLTVERRRPLPTSSGKQLHLALATRSRQLE